MTKVTWKEIDKVLDSLLRNRLTPDGRKVVLDGACGNVMKEGLAYACTLSRKEAEGMSGLSNLDHLRNDLREVIGCDIRGLPDLVVEFNRRLPPGHHMTPGARINTVAYTVAEWARESGYSTVGVDFNGTAPEGGPIDKLFLWWITTRSTTWAETYPDKANHLHRLLNACGFERIEEIMALGYELERAGITLGDPHTL